MSVMGERVSKIRPRPIPIEITRANIAEFMQRFDTLISDCDGVIWTPLTTIPLAKEGLSSIKEAGKKVLFATNNSVLAPFTKFKKLGYNVQKNEVVFPAIAIAGHLEKIGFRKTAYVLGVEHFKDFLREKGVKVLPERKLPPERIAEDLPSVLRAVQRDPDVGAVVVDLDVNLNFHEITQAVNHLKNQDCLFFVGATDDFVTFDDGKTLLGPGHFLRTIEECSGKKADVFGKPGPMMVTEYLKDRHNLDLKRTVFVGDSLKQDMAIANACGMMKLLVLTGMTQLKDLETCDPQLLPDYYINSIGDFASLLKPQG